MAGYPANGTDIIKKIFTALEEKGPMTVREIASEILEDEEDVDRALHESEGECVQRLYGDKEVWSAIPGEDDDDDDEF